MKELFLVLGIVNGSTDYCRLFESFLEAGDEAKELANLYSGPKASEWVVHLPPEVKNSAGQSEFTYLDTNKRSVKIISLAAKPENPAPATNNTNQNVGTPVVQLQQAAVTLPADDPFAPDLPAGWSSKGRPLKIIDFLQDPHSYQDLSFISDDMVRALVCARIVKRPYYKCNMDTTFFSHSKDKVLQEIKDQTDFGNQVVDYEVKILEDFINNNVNK
jgi:hypothetical protein